MSPEEIRLAAAELGLSEERVRRLQEVLAAAYGEGEVSNSYTVTEQDPDGKEVWEVEVGAEATGPSGLTARYNFRVLVDGHRLHRGCSWTPDWFHIETASDGVLFVGEVVHPDNPEDDAGWARYELFGPLRNMAFDAVFARLATGRLTLDCPDDLLLGAKGSSGSNDDPGPT